MLLQDIRYALRLLLKHPGFTALAVLTLGLGIGANTAIFSVVHAVLLEPLPFPEPERLFQVWESRVERGWDRMVMNPANFWDFREQNRTFEDLTALFERSVTLTGRGFPERLDGAEVSAGFFRVLGAVPVHGRTFAPGEDEPASPGRVVLLAHDFWHARFGADPEILGTSLTLDGESFTVVGVLPPGEPWLDAADVFMPLVRDPEARRVGFLLPVIGRLKPGVTAAAARSDLEAVARRLEEQYPEAAAGIGVDLQPASDWIADDELRRALLVLFATVGVLLLITCVNLANMLLAQAAGRTRETAMRAVLGADRGRIAWQSLTESLVLGLLGTGAGLLLARGGLDLVKAFDPGGIPRLGQAGLDPGVLASTIFVGLSTGILAGLVPALRPPYSDLATALRDGDRASASRARKRWQNALVTAEVALSVLLVVGAGLLLRSFGELMRVERGFETENRLMASVAMPAHYDQPRRDEVRERFLERVEALPAVRSAAAVSLRPFAAGSTGMGIAAADRPEDPDAEVPWASWRLVTGGYFHTMGIPRLGGRSFDQHDRLGESWRVVVSERLAELLWPDGEDPVGRTAVLWKGQVDQEAEIVGVVGSLRERGLEDDPTLAVYLPYNGGSRSPVHFVMEGENDLETLVPTLRSLLADIDPALALSDVRGLDEMVGDSVATRRFNMMLMTIFAGVALGLALAGIYGVQACSVSHRTSEIGVRVALGARRGQILRLILRQGMTPAAWGIVLGLAGALVLSRLMTALLFEVEPGDPWTYAGVTLAIAAAALVACWVPTRRALRCDPVAALREE